MRLKSLGSSFLLLFALLLAACSSGKHKHSSAPSGGGTDGDDGGGAAECIDRDGDGYGENCDRGSDCDDHDDTITDECRRCIRPGKDCPCKAGTAPLDCVPPDIKVDGGVLVCKQGSRYCRDSYWSDCETIGGYVFQAQ